MDWDCEPPLLGDAGAAMRAVDLNKSVVQPARMSQTFVATACDGDEVAVISAAGRADR